MATAVQPLALLFACKACLSPRLETKNSDFTKSAKLGHIGQARSSCKLALVPVIAGALNKETK